MPAFKTNFLAVRQNIKLIFILLLAVLYMGGIHLLNGKISAYKNAIASRKADLAWMRQAAKKAQILKGETTAVTPDEFSELNVAQLNKSAAHFGLQSQVKSLQPLGPGKVAAFLESAPFSEVVKWLGSLHEGGVRVLEFKAERRPQRGLVDVHLTVEKKI